VLQIGLMSTYDLVGDAGLRTAIETIGSPSNWGESGQQWVRELAETIVWVRSSNEAQRGTREFQKRLWDENRVASIGQGNIAVDRALEDAGFRHRVATRSIEPLPVSVEDRLRFVTALYQDLSKWIQPFTRNVPHLKIFRVLAAFYPEAMTSIASMGPLAKLTNAMGGDRSLDSAGRHVWVRHRLDSLLGDPDSSNQLAVAERMALPWMIYERFVQPPPPDRTEKETGPGETQLVPLSAARRRRGLTAIKGLFPGLLSVLEFVRDGVTREELIDFLRTSSPDSKVSSLGVTINSYKGEFGAIRLEGDRYVLTERGESVLESQDPSDLADWLLTRVLGVDNAIVTLRDRGPTSASDLTAILRTVNPGWTSDYAPQSLIAWLRSMGVVQTEGSSHSLTDVGRQWAARIHWQPESLPLDIQPESLAVAPIQPDLRTNASEQLTTSGDPVFPRLAEIVGFIQAAGHFERSMIERLHIGIWAQPIRHFAVLTGLSGSGKTLLARLYASALIGRGSPKQLFTLPVQPGWYDPGALLGFTNPLRGDSYVRTPFLEFLLAAAADLRRPYIVVLDEMNLSHPEQYMAPLLSAMETGDAVQLHTEGDIFDGVPRAIPYPRNLVLIGTINMDETTHGLSDKVLDRAFVHEFWNIDVASYPRWGTRQIEPANEDRARVVLVSLMKALSPARLHFGWRVVDDVLDFLSRAVTDESELSFESALDSVINAKVLPKLRGEDSARFREALRICEETLPTERFEVSGAKITELRRDLETTGSARFWR
jgi:5-methylcytosine-specific restriction protein B